MVHWLGSTLFVANVIEKILKFINYHLSDGGVAAMLLLSVVSTAGAVVVSSWFVFFWGAARGEEVFGCSDEAVSLGECSLSTSPSSGSDPLCDVPGFISKPWSSSSSYESSSL